MRGKATVLAYRFFWSGITPAYAGKSHSLGISLLLVGDHPRLCGEKGSVYAQSWEKAGSPPPMRGKVLLLHILAGHFGITPAYAGKRPQHPLARKSRRDHPRLCGEKFQTFFCKVYVPGSPPPMRGKAVASAVPFRRCRDHPRLCGEKESVPESGIGALWITPAYAGKRYQRWSVAIVRWDHPRLCGEKAFTNNDVFRNFRITPAYAGKRLRNGTHLTMSWDHPRLCGEKGGNVKEATEEAGSPPPMRGKAAEKNPLIASHGITPAYAGKSPHVQG